MSEKITALVCGAPSGQPNAEVLPDVCPKCGQPTQFGYGLMGGGMGAYVLCESDDCDFFAKRQDPDDE